MPTTDNYYTTRMINGCIIHNMCTGLPRLCIAGEDKYFALDDESLFI